MVDQYGDRKWALIAEKMIGRAGKQCRERWHNHLRPDIKVFDFDKFFDQVKFFFPLLLYFSLAFIIDDLRHHHAFAPLIHMLCCMKTENGHGDENEETRKRTFLK